MVGGDCVECLLEVVEGTGSVAEVGVNTSGVVERHGAQSVG